MEIKTKYETPTEPNIPGIIYLPRGPVADMEPLEPIKIFDNAYFIGTKFVGVLIVKTSEGLVLIDAFENEAAVKRLLLPGMQKLGLSPEDITHVIVTHGHFDHFGGGEFLQKEYGCKVLMSKVDAEFMVDKPMFPEQFMPIGVPSVDEYIDDGSKICVGDTEFSIYFTPGHTPGGISLTFPILENGVKHTVCLWGGIGMPSSLNDQLVFLKSAKYFLDVCINEKADVEFSTHPFVDYGCEKMDMLKKKDEKDPNPFIAGQEKVEMFMRCMILSIEDNIQRNKAK